MDCSVLIGWYQNGLKFQYEVNPSLFDFFLKKSKKNSSIVRPE